MWFCWGWLKHFQFVIKYTHYVNFILCYLAIENIDKPPLCYLLFHFELFLLSGFIASCAAHNYYGELSLNAVWPPALTPGQLNIINLLVQIEVCLAISPTPPCKAQNETDASPWPLLSCCHIFVFFCAVISVLVSCSMSCKQICMDFH